LDDVGWVPGGIVSECVRYDVGLLSLMYHRASPYIFCVADEVRQPKKGIRMPKPMMEIHWPKTWSPGRRAKRE
jgi:hypothetical protein